MPRGTIPPPFPILRAGTVRTVSQGSDLGRWTWQPHLQDPRGADPRSRGLITDEVGDEEKSDRRADEMAHTVTDQAQRWSGPAPACFARNPQNRGIQLSHQRREGTPSENWADTRIAIPCPVSAIFGPKPALLAQSWQASILYNAREILEVLRGRPAVAPPLFRISCCKPYVPPDRRGSFGRAVSHALIKQAPFDMLEVISLSAPHLRHVFPRPVLRSRPGPSDLDRRRRWARRMAAGTPQGNGVRANVTKRRSRIGWGPSDGLGLRQALFLRVFGEFSGLSMKRSPSSQAARFLCWPLPSAGSLYLSPPSFRRK